MLQNDKSPGRDAGELDNRGSHFYLTLYWAEALANQDKDADLKTSFTSVAKALQENEAAIVNELNSVQGKSVDIGGYYHPDAAKLDKVMRPSALLNQALAQLV